VNQKARGYLENNEIGIVFPVNYQESYFEAMAKPFLSFSRIKKKLVYM
jgi:hypothetical protein